MKLSINRIRAIVFLVAALGYLPLQSAEQATEKHKLSDSSKIEKVDKVKKEPAVSLSKS